MIRETRVRRSFRGAPDDTDAQSLLPHTAPRN